MLVYRIVLSHRTKSLNAPGYSARWNSKGKFMIYTAGSRALACLENVVHRSSEGLAENFKTMTIQIPDNLKIDEIVLKDLPAEWQEYQNYVLTQHLGNKWLENAVTAILKIPSAIIPDENNFLLNPFHPDFKKIKIKNVEDFIFDPRIK